MATRAGNSNALFIQTFDQTTGTPSDQPFHVMTYCRTSDKKAVVDSTGVLARGSHVLSTAHLGTGSYEVIFDVKSVAKCAFTASIGTTGAGSVASPGEITVAGRAGNKAGVFVRTVDRAGNSLDSPFHLAVNCGLKKVFAVIEGTGTFVRGSHVVSVAKLSGVNGGTYEVIFDGTVSGCSYTATIGTTGNGGSISTPVTITTATRAGNANGVFIFIHQTNGATIDEPFHLFVLCPFAAAPPQAPAPGDGGGAQDNPTTAPSSTPGGASGDGLNGPVAAPERGNAADDGS